MSNKQTLGEEILALLRQKADAEFEYHNPNFLSEISDLIDSYYEVGDPVVDKWIHDMFGA